MADGQRADLPHTTIAAGRSADLRAAVARGRRPPGVRGALLAGATLLLLLLLLLLGMSVAPGVAPAAQVDGIADQNIGLWNASYLDPSGASSGPFPSFFSSAWLGIPASQIAYARFVTAPDAVAQGGACEQNLAHWFSYVTATLHLIPVIAVWNVDEGGCANHGVPSTGDYRRDVRALLRYLDSLGHGRLAYFEAWNEPNASGVAPAHAAAYWLTANSVCATAGCTALAGDFVDDDPDQGPQTFAPGCTANLTYEDHLKPYEKEYVSALGSARPAIWAFHPYYAVNCEQGASVATFADNLPSPRGAIWFTEVGAWECYGGQSPPRGLERQQQDADYLVHTLMSASSPAVPAHVFYYELAASSYTEPCEKYTDSAVYQAGPTPGALYARPAAATIFGADGVAPAAAVAGERSLGPAEGRLEGTRASRPAHARDRRLEAPLDRAPADSKSDGSPGGAPIAKRALTPPGPPGEPVNWRLSYCQTLTDWTCIVAGNAVAASGAPPQSLDAPTARLAIR